MISLFEQVGSATDLPAGMVCELVTRGSRSVSALNFFSMDSARESLAEISNSVVDDPAPLAIDERAVQMAAMIEAARDDAGEQVRRQMQVQWGHQQERERARSERLTVEFARDRRRYFAAAEAQVVKLALAIAERILSREAATSALPLSATVKAALARVQDGSETVLRVHPEEAEQWRTFFADEPRITVAEDPRLSTEDCVLETSIGRIDLGIATQMQEIERGFDDLILRTGD